MLTCFFSGCMALPKQDLTASYALPASQAAGTSTAQALERLLKQQPAHLSGVYPLIEADEAFAARMLMARHAERSLDIQYYIWRADMTGLMLLEAVHEAADRGVRVRLLLDDNNSAGLEPFLLAMDAHPNIEVRLFNPFVVRKPRWLGFVTDFKRVNRRMHNKSFTADSVVTIVGGRNIGDAYFGAADDELFADLDVLTVGAVVPEVSADFDRYWNSSSAYGLSSIVKANGDVSLPRLAQRAEDIARNPAAQIYLESLRESDLIADLFHQRIEFKWARVRIVSDEPDKVLGAENKEKMLLSQLQEIIGNPRQEVELVSPYFVPTKTGVAAFAWLSRKGVSVKVLTNSLAATDVAAVHSGYGKRRKALLKAGVELYELRHVQPKTKKEKKAEKKARKGRLLGSSGSSLHAKTFSVDAKHVFVGSFNFDPRSALLNTELGFVIDSPELAERISRSFREEIPQQAYQVKLDKKGRLYWLEREGEQTIIHAKEPTAKLSKRLSAYLLSWLPIDSLL